jgi:hypothetical protein
MSPAMLIRSQVVLASATSLASCSLMLEGQRIGILVLAGVQAIQIVFESCSAF